MTRMGDECVSMFIFIHILTIYQKSSFHVKLRFRIIQNQIFYQNIYALNFENRLSTKIDQNLLIYNLKSMKISVETNFI